MSQSCQPPFETPYPDHQLNIHPLMRELSLTIHRLKLQIIFTFMFAHFLAWDGIAIGAEEFSSNESLQDLNPIDLTIKSGPIQGKKNLNLSDVVTCQGDGTVCEETYGVELSLPVKPDMEQTLSAEKIMQIVKSEWPNRQFNLSGPKSIKIINQTFTISESKIMSSLEEVLKATQEDGQFLITIRKIQAPSAITLPDENAQIIFPDLADANLKNPDWVRKNLSGNQRIRMTFSRGFSEGTKGIPFFSIMTNFRLEEMVPVAARDIQKGEIIKESDVILAPYECCKISPPIIRETSAIIGRKSKILVRYGQAFASGSTENLRIISRGQSAQLIIRKEDLVIVGKVQALDSGSYGDVIDALYPTTKKRLRVRVVDPSTVESVN